MCRIAPRPTLSGLERDQVNMTDLGKSSKRASTYIHIHPQASAQNLGPSSDDDEDGDVFGSAVRSYHLSDARSHASTRGDKKSRCAIARSRVSASKASEARKAARERETCSGAQQQILL